MAVGDAGSVADRLTGVKARIASAAERSGRPANAVTLVAVSKTFGVDAIREALAAGVTDLGENRAQEFRQKAEILGTKARWHFVGHVQTNKARHVVGAHLIHSVDRIGLAEALDARARRSGLVQEVLIEVNVTGETAKHGVEPGRLAALAEKIAALEGLKVRGLMTMAPLSDDPETSRPVFAELRTLRDVLVSVVSEATELSMGMTGDLEVGIEEGATIVRVGRAIFGPRGYPVP